ncbi:MAG: hypothetical protein HY291_01235 [Planctomycetes bacterium]|nr:hypothetical protein [Planctomycetota bacterium]
MKIGPLNVGIPTLVYLALVVIVALADFQLFTAKTAQRAEGRLERSIRECMNEGTDDALRQGVDFCRQVLAVTPNSASAHLYLGSFLFRQGQYKEAQGAFETCAKLPGIAAGDAGMAYTGAGVSAFAQAPAGERSKSTAAAEELFKKALEADKNSPDAKACLGIMLLWKGGLSAPTDALAKFNEVLEGKRPPAKTIASRMYNARGVTLSRLGRAGESDESFLAAQTIDPGWRAVQENRTLSLISSLGLPGMPVDMRMKLIDKYKDNLSVFKPYEYAARNSIATGLYLTRKDVMSKAYLEKNFPLAEKLLFAASGDKPAEPAAYRNLAGLYQDRLYGDPGEGGRDGLLAQLPPDYFRPAMTAPNIWKDGATADRPQAAQQVLDDIRKCANAESEALTRLMNKAKLDTPQQVDAQLHIFGAQYILMATSTAAEAEKRQSELLKSAAAMVALAEENPAALRAYGSLLLRAGDYKKAFEFLGKARAKGDGSEELGKALEDMSRKPVVFDMRPRRVGHFGKGRPLFGGSIQVLSCPGAVNATLTVDGKKMDAAMSGTQLLALAYDTQMTDGEHKIEIEAEDAIGNKAQMSTSHFVDKRPPTLKLDPDGGELDGPRPVWTIALEDVGVGIDQASVKVEFNSLGAGSTPCKDLLVSEGVYQKEISSLNVKQNDRIPGDTFKIAPIRDLGAGAYQLRIVFADKAGNLKTELKAVKIK